MIFNGCKICIIYVCFTGLNKSCEVNILGNKPYFNGFAVEPIDVFILWAGSVIVTVLKL